MSSNPGSDCTTWEYGTLIGGIPVLDEAGKLGWEVVQVVVINPPPDLRLWAFLKRPLSCKELEKKRESSGFNLQKLYPYPPVHATGPPNQTSLSSRNLLY